MLHVAAVRHATFGVNPDHPTYPGLTDLLDERFAAYGVRLDPAVRLAGNGNSFARMSATLLPELTAGRDLDVVLLAHAVPDCDQRTSVAGYLQQRVAGDPLVCAVTEQGRTTPFAALRLAGALCGTGARTVAVLVLDQGTVPRTDAQTAALDVTTDHAVGVLIAAGGPIGLRLSPHRAGIPPEQAGAELSTQLDALAPRHEVTVLLGDGFPDASRHLGGHPVRRAEPGRLCTAVWTVLATELAATSARPRTLVAAEYEPALGYLCLAAFDVPPTGSDRWTSPFSTTSSTGPPPAIRPEQR